MIKSDNLKVMLDALGFLKKGNVYSKKFQDFDCSLKVDLNKKQIIYPEEKGLKVNERQTCNLSSNENFVVLECVHRLMEKGYNPKHIELEPKWKVGHGASGGRADVLVRDNNGKALLIIECKNAGREFTKHWNETLENGSQLFGYAQQEGNAQYLCLYASDLIDEDIKSEYYLISLIDNENFLIEHPKLESYKNAKVREELFNVWTNTYQQDYTTKGIFEKDIQAYYIGKNKYTVEDLAVIDDDSKGKMHNRFATILRKYNVSGRENAFDKLINLFLCKIVDEKQNPTDLKFYWKGVAYDTAYELQDRLQKLYKEGMGNFLKEEVTYIDNEQINNAFRFFKNDPDATRDTIKNYFKQLKFFTNNDFAFIDVHNERLFYENTQILTDIVRLFQDTKIKSNDKNQFLGDMFENFLDSGVKQSEGQFFTPMPITRFIIQSLPLKNIIAESQKPPKAVDYACGSGHFLNELASQMEPFIKESKDVKIEDYHKAIYGIEKEYRLSKVAKVSSFMYGQDNINIAYADGLVKHEDFKEKDFKILVANPPYSVKGFLGTLSKDDRALYDLSMSVDDKSIETNNSIECFFIERAKQLLDSNGVAAIIVPSSIVSNTDSTYIGTREILLKYFDIVAIAEFGSGTFGKTGTNTVTLFIRRKGDEPETAEHYKNRVDSWFEEDKDKEKVFEDGHFIKEYCQYIEIDYDKYESLLLGNPNDRLLETEIFKEYKVAFDKLTTTKKKKKQASFKSKTKEEQEEILLVDFVRYVKLIEKDKLYYFTLASNNASDVLIVKAPGENKANKKFLGYEWSAAKGSEGIKLTTDAKGKHITPLYDVDDRNNVNKINYYIKQAFAGEKPAIVDELSEFISRSTLVNMLDFSRVGFDKAFSLTPKNMNPIMSKWKAEKINDIFLEVKNGKSVKQLDNKGLYKVSRIETIAEGVIDFDAVKWTNDKIQDKDLLQKGDILFSHINSVKHLGKTAIYNGEEKLVHGINLLKFRANNEIANPFYLIEIFKSEIFRNEIQAQAQKAINQASVNTSYLKELRIPIPPIDIQDKIVDECKAVDDNSEWASKEIQKRNTEIKEIIGDIFKEGTLDKIKNLNSLLSRGKTTKYGFSDIQVIKSGQARGYEEFDFSERHYAIETFKLDERQLKKGDLLINSTGVGTAGRVTLFDLEGAFVADSHITIFRTNDKILPKYALYCLSYIGFKTIEKMAKGSGGQIELTKSTIEEIKLPILSLEDQKNIVAKLKAKEIKIEKAKEVVRGMAEKKQVILKKYL